MIVGNVQYSGKALIKDVVYPDTIKKVKKGEWIIAPLNKCRELVETGDFIPDEDTQKLFDQFIGQTLFKKNIDGMLKGKKCFIIGSGDSLRGFDFSRLDNEFTIGVNHTIVYYSKVKSIIFLDANFLDKNDKEARKILQNYKGLIFCSFRTQYNKENKNAIPFYVNNDKVENKFSKGIFGSRLSGLAAISLAIIMDANKIYLLGFDLDEKAMNIHFYDEKEKVPYGNDKGYRGDRIKGHINSFKSFNLYKDRIFNLNPESKIPFFNFVSIEEALNEVAS